MGNYLDDINFPDDLKELNIEQLKVLSTEIREFLIKSISKTGGHLSSNLGMVELSIALHYCFNLPKDKIIWDVGHQAYIHKILTGRKDRFNTLRQEDGLSGYPKITESEYDAFGAGHSSTSISAALGYAKARDLKQEENSVVAVIGDGSFTGGMVFEALNNVGHSNTNMIIILNDNEMSISKNVGTLSKYLSSIRTQPKYINVKEGVANFVNGIPRVGKRIFRSLKNAKAGIKYFLIPGVLFEELGLTYLGPIDGHDVNEVVDMLNRAKNMKEPVIVHVKTKKGKGYRYAEANPTRFHGVSRFNISTGKALSKSKETFSDVFGKFMSDNANRYKNMVAVTAAMPEGTGLHDFAKKYPTRCFDVGIAEQHAVTFAAGLALGGFKPVVAIYSSFLQRAYDQIVHDVCIQNLPVVFALDRAGIVGADGETHQGAFDISYMNHIPNMTLLAPRNKQELVGMLHFSMEHDGPVAVRYPRGCVNNVDNTKQAKPIEYGKSEIMQNGHEVAIIGVGVMNDVALAVSKQLKEIGIVPTIINARFVKPMDTDMLRDLSNNHSLIVTIEENVMSGGYGSNIATYVVNNNIDVNVKNFAIPDEFIRQGERASLLERIGLSSDNLYKYIVNELDKMNDDSKCRIN